MNCEICEKKKPVVIKGEAKGLEFRLFNEYGDPFDLTNATEIEVLLKQQDSESPLIKKLSTQGVTINSATGGRFMANLTSDDTALLEESDAAFVEIHVTMTVSLVVTVLYAQIQNAMKVSPSFFPGTP